MVLEGDIEKNQIANQQLKGIKLEGFKSLFWILFNKNNLDTIDLSQCPNFEFIALKHNKLTSFDVSKLTKLDTFYLEDNKISEASFVTFITSLPAGDATDNA